MSPHSFMMPKTAESKDDNHFIPSLKNDRSIPTKHGRLGVKLNSKRSNTHKFSLSFVCTEACYFPPDFIMIQILQQAKK